MIKSRDAAEKVASSNRYVLCKMPADWTTLPVHAGLQPPFRSIAVYTKKRSNQTIVYEGYICPPAPEKVPVSALLPPPRGLSFGQKYARLREKIRAEEAEAETQAKIIAEVQKSRDFAASSKPGQSAVKAEPSLVPGHEDTADESKQQIKEEAVATRESENPRESLNLSLQRTESNTDYPLPLEILDSRERLLPAPPEGEDFIYGFESWENTLDIDCFCFESDSSVQLFNTC